MSVRPDKDRIPRDVKLNFGGKPSGLKNPSRSLRGLGAITLALEAVVLLLAIAPLRMLQSGIPNGQLWILVGAAVAAILLTGLLGRPIGWWLGLALQGLLLACWPVHWLIGVVGLFFGLVWLYVLYVRRKVLL